MNTSRQTIRSYIGIIDSSAIEDIRHQLHIESGGFFAIVRWVYDGELTIDEARIALADIEIRRILGPGPRYKYNHM